MQPLNSNLVLILSNPLRVKVWNYGIYDETNFDLACKASAKGMPDYRDTVHVPLVKAGKSVLVDFKPIRFKDSVNVDIQTEILHMNSPDANPRNDRFVCQASVSNRVDDFESESGLWDFRGGWGVTTSLNPRGTSSCHVNCGKNYEKNADAVMTLKPALNVLSLKNAYIQYWTKYFTQTDKDILYVEASADSMNWVKLDSLSGTMNNWGQKKVDLSGMLDPGTDHFWVRFHFKSDNTIQKLGVFLDDIEIYPNLMPDDSTGVDREEAASQPGKWDLAQNYPNPFNPSTSISYSLAEKAYVEMKIRDILGREIRILFAGDQTAGSHRAEWNGLDDRGGRAPSGIYFYTLTAKGFRETRKLVMLR